jgi:hypothetical protein
MQKHIMMRLIMVAIITLCAISCQKTEVKDGLDLPSLESIQGFDKSQFSDLLKKMNNISLHDATVHFEMKIIEYFEQHELIEIVSMDFYNDPKSVKTNNKEEFQNLFVDIGLSLDKLSKTRNELEDVAKEVNRDLFLVFKEDTYGYLKLNTLTIEFLIAEIAIVKHSNGITLLDLPL